MTDTQPEAPAEPTLADEIVAELSRLRAARDAAGAERDRLEAERRAERNARLFWASCRAAGAVADGEMPANEAAAALEQAAHAAGLHGLEVQRTILSGFRSASGGRAAA